MTGPLIVASVSTKGGVGKTTLTLAVGAELANRGHRVMVIDLDGQDLGSAEQWINDAHDAPQKLDAVSIDDLSEVTRERLTAQLVDFVLIDAPPGLMAINHVRAAIAVADLALIPMRANEVDIGLQTHMLVKKLRPELPTAGVIIDSLQQTIMSAKTRTKRADLATEGLEVVRTVRRAQLLAEAREDCLLPCDAASDDAGFIADVEAMADWVSDVSKKRGQ